MIQYHKAKIDFPSLYQNSKYLIMQCSEYMFHFIVNILNSTEIRIIVASPIAKRIFGISNLHSPYIHNFGIFQKSRLQYDFQKWIIDGRLLLVENTQSILDLLNNQISCTSQIIIASDTVVNYSINIFGISPPPGQICKFEECAINYRGDSVAVSGTYPTIRLFYLNSRVANSLSSSEKNFPHFNMTVDASEMLIHKSEHPDHTYPMIPSRLTFESIIQLIKRVGFFITRRV